MLGFRWFARRRSRPAKFSSRRRQQIESLESRLVLSSFAVINTNDSGAGSFRQAILDANASANVGGQIRFRSTSPVRASTRFSR